MSRTCKLLIFSGLLLAMFMDTQPLIANPGHKKTEDAFMSGTPLLALDAKHVLQDNFAVVKTVAAIPEPIQKSIVGSGTINGMADPGHPYEISDVVGPKPLPFRRLVFATVSPNYCLLYNEYGGYGTGQEVTLYRTSSDCATVVWRASLLHNTKYLTWPQLRQAIEESNLNKDHK